MQIRIASEKDIGVLAELWIELMEHHRNFNPQFKVDEAKRAVIEEQINKMMNRQHTRIYVAEADGSIVAMLWARIESKPEMFVHQRSGYIAETVVKKAYRGKNIGNELVDAAHDWFKSEGILFSELLVSVNNVSSIDFWKSKGYETHLFRMQHRLNEEI